jgi:broad specificity phosphatase PhoE
VFNVEGRWQGRADSPLTERGVAQARQLGQALAGEDVAAVYSSDLGRAIRTAEPIAAHHGLAVTADARLSEIDVGAWTGRLGTELSVSDPDTIAVWKTRPAQARLPDGETLEGTQTRALSFFMSEMARHAGRSVVVISHGTVGQCILIAGLGGTVDDLWLNERLVNCSLSRLEWTPETGLRVVELVDVRHLEEVGSIKTWRVVDQTDEDAA